MCIYLFMIKYKKKQNKQTNLKIKINKSNRGLQQIMLISAWELNDYAAKFVVIINFTNPNVLVFAQSICSRSHRNIGGYSRAICLFYSKGVRGSAIIPYLHLHLSVTLQQSRQLAHSLLRIVSLSITLAHVVCYVCVAGVCKSLHER